MRTLQQVICVAVGYHALGANTTGTSNTALGKDTLAANTTGEYNTGIGLAALGASTTGSNNVAVGSGAGDAATTASYNTSVGAGALSAATTGQYNTVVGYNALDAITTGAESVAIGSLALTQASGSSNVALGHKAGENVSTGTNNVLLGKETGRSGAPGGNITTGDNSVCIGNANIASANIQVDWTIASDKRDKTDVSPLDLGLDFINQLEPVTYRWDKRSKYSDDQSVIPDGTHKEEQLEGGFLAQDVEVIENQYGYKTDDKTNLITNLSEDGKMYGIKYSKLVPMLTKAIQELSTKVEDLENKLNNK